MRFKFLYIQVISLLVLAVFFAGKPVERKQEILSIINVNENQWQSFVYDSQVFEDMVILNHASNRRIFHVLPFEDWDQLSEDEQLEYRDVLRNEFCLDAEDRI